MADEIDIVSGAAASGEAAPVLHAAPLANRNVY